MEARVFLVFSENGLTVRRGRNGRGVFVKDRLQACDSDNSIEVIARYLRVNPSEIIDVIDSIKKFVDFNKDGWKK